MTIGLRAPRTGAVGMGSHVAGGPALVAARLLLCAALALPRAAMAQPADAPARAESPFAWILVGVDVVQERWRGTVKTGHLGDIQRRIVLGELAIVTHPAMHVVLGHVDIAARGRNASHAALTRLGATWLPVRRRVTVENRFLIEHRSGGAAGAPLRGRDRLRISGVRPGGLPFAVFASVEVLAAGSGLLETRIQLGGVRTAGPLLVECYWLQRQLRAGTGGNGVGLTLSWRIAS